MPIQTSIEQKFFNQLLNGSDFSLNTSNHTSNLVAIAGEKIKAVIDIGIGWDSQSDVVNFWTLSAPSPGNGRIQRVYGSFRTDGFDIGQSFDYFTTYSGVPVFAFSGTITAISAIRIDFSVDSGVLTPGTATDSGIRALAASWPLVALDWSFGFPAQSESYSNISKVSGSPMGYTVTGIGLGGPRSTTPVAMSQVGAVSDWVSGTATAAFVSETDYEQVFRIEHVFVMAPFAKTDVGAAIVRSMSFPPLAYSENMRYSYVAFFKKSATASFGVTVNVDNVGGVTKWYNDVFTATDYEVVSVDYVDTDTLDPQTSLIVSERTTATITLNKIPGAFAAGQRAGLMVCYVPRDLSEFQQTTTTQTENFIYDTLFHDEGTAATVGTGAIKSLECTLNAGDLVVTAEVEYSMTEAQKAEGGSYLLAVVVGDQAGPAEDSDRISLLADARSYTDVNVVPLLCQFNSPVKFYKHDTNLAGAGTATVEAWNEDGIVVKIPFDLDLARNAVLSAFTVKLVAYKVADGSYFDLDQYRFNTAGAIISGGVQQININEQRPYTLPDSDAFRQAKIETGALVGDLQGYVCTIGQKISWQDWIALPGADSVFFNNSEPNNGLNEKASNYSLQNGYEIRIVAEATVQGSNNLDTPIWGVSEGVSGTITVNDYDTGTWTCVIKTRNPATLADLGGDILAASPTVFRAEFTKAAPFTSTSQAAFVIARIEDFGDTGYGIAEYSSIRPNLDGRLYSIDGSGLLKLSIEAGKLVAECLINPAGFAEGARFNLSARGQQKNLGSFSGSFGASFS